MIENQTFEKIDFTSNTINVDEYDACIFQSCNFENQNLDNFTFIDCEFIDCNLSLIKATNTAFKTVKFSNCKLLGVDFSQCNTFLLNMNFESCVMNLTSFYQLKIKQKVFNNCSLNEADFSETDLSESNFNNCDLKRAIFNRSVLIKTDFTSALNFSIDPETNKIKGAKFSKNNLVGLLTKYQLKIN
jgi:fluoroquinolone resistance protein